MTIEDITVLLKPFAEKHNLDALILFGSRAQGCNAERSDIDLAVSGGDYLSFKHDVMDNARTLLMFDIVNYNTASERLKGEIDRYGKFIYYKASII